MADDVIKRTYTIPLRTGYAETPRYKRTNKAMRVLKAFLVRHMKSEDIKIGPALNERLWSNGIRNPPGKVKVTVTKDAENVVRAELEGIEYKDFAQEEKKVAPKNLQEKLKQTVEDAKKPKEEKVEQSADSKPAEKEPVAAKTETKKTESKPAAKKEAPKAEAKEAETKAEPAKAKEAPAKEEPKAE